MPVQETVIEARQGRLLPYLRELWQYRELLLFLSWKQIKVRYAKTTLGFGWMLIRPLLHLTVLTVIFGYFARFPSDGIPYPAFVLTGLLPWLFFIGALGKASSSLSSNPALMRKVYVPRLYLPLVPLVASLADLAVTFVITLAFLMLRYDQPLSADLWLLPVPLALAAITATGAGFWLAVLTVKFEDAAQLLGNVLQLLMFATPVIWPMSMLVNRFGPGVVDGYAFYPMAGVLEACRHLLLGVGEMPWKMLATGSLTAGVLLVSGFWYFRRHERELADIV